MVVLVINLLGVDNRSARMREAPRKGALGLKRRLQPEDEQRVTGGNRDSLLAVHRE